MTLKDDETSVHPVNTSALKMLFYSGMDDRCDLPVVIYLNSLHPEFIFGCHF